VDIEGVEFASQRAMYLLASHAGAQVCEGALEVYPLPHIRRPLSARWQRINDMIGVDVDPKRIRSMMDGLGLEWEGDDDEAFSVKIPARRGDLEREVDLVEEVARLNGLDAIPAPAPRAQIIPGAAHPSYTAQRALRTQLSGMGLSGILNYSLTSTELLDRLDSENADARINLPNPISQDQAVLRTSLLPQLLETLGRNRAHQVDTCALYELGKAYRSTGDEETLMLSAGLYGAFGKTYLNQDQPNDDQDTFLRLKGIIEAIFASCKLALTFEASERDLFTPGQAAHILLDEKSIGIIGLVDEKHRHPHRLNAPVAVAEWQVAPLIAAHGRVETMSPIPTHPSVSRDAALIVASNTQHADIESVIRKTAPNELESVHLFDIFTGERLGADRKSLAYRTVFRAADRSLTDDEVNAMQERIREALARDVKATFS